MRSVAIVGAGKMGESILKGWIASDVGAAATLNPESFLVVEPNEDRRIYLQQTYGVKACDGVQEALTCDLVLLAVKPQVMADVLGTIALEMTAMQNDDAKELPLFVSIAAGMTTERILSMLERDVELVRVMPNMPLQVSAGASAVCGARTATVQSVELVKDLFSCLGIAVVLPESLMDAATALNGSGPAYVAKMIEAMRDAAVDEGLERDVAERLALQTVYGTALVLHETGQDVGDFKKSICSPGGTTLAALDAMDQAGFDEVFVEGIHAAVVRAKELASC